jgi:3-(3-hydroxy-phenyl)propionate hydroxylase
MHQTYTYETFAYKPCREQQTGHLTRHPVIVVGAGPVGLSAAVDLANSGIKVVLIDQENRVSEGSRAICFAKRTLEVFDRLGCCQPMRAKGITWNVGRLYYKDQEVYHFNLLPEAGHAHPAFINLQQYYVEEYLIKYLQTLPGTDLRWCHKLVGLDVLDDGLQLTVETPDGMYHTACDYLIAADGARSPTRTLMHLNWEGMAFEEKFLITDIVMHADFPSERRFWFDPPFNPGQSALLHCQPDNVWRLDFQLGREADAEEAKKPENVIPRLKAMLGDDVEFTLEWVSIYSFQSRMLDTFRHGRVLFVGDAAHVMSVFGARGANSGIQDVDNLVWKLKLVMDGQAPETLLDSYSAERTYAARENLAHTSSSVQFMSPHNKATCLLRNAVLELAREFPFARLLINSGRLSTATIYRESPLNTPDEAPFEGHMMPGANCADAPVQLGGERAWFLQQLGHYFHGLLFVDAVQTISPALLAELEALAEAEIPIKTIIVTNESDAAATYGRFPVLGDVDHLLRQRYHGRHKTFYLIRPDQYICARWRAFHRPKVDAALARACGRVVGEP